MKNYFNDCIDCKERYMGCHSKCEKYKTARAKKDTDNDIIRKSKEGDIMFNSFLASRRERYDTAIRHRKK